MLVFHFFILVGKRDECLVNKIGEIWFAYGLGVRMVIGGILDFVEGVSWKISISFGTVGVVTILLTKLFAKKNKHL